LKHHAAALAPPVTTGKIQCSGIHINDLFLINITIALNCFRLSELNFALREVKLNCPAVFTQHFTEQHDETEHYLVAKSYFDLKEYDR
jgi:hypothetical protein